SLSVKRNNGIRGVADQCNRIVEGPWMTFYGHQRAGRVVKKVIHQRWHQWQRVAALFVKKTLNVLFSLEFCERFFSLERQKQRAGETAVGIGQCDHHKVAPWPDVQGILLE